MAFSINRATILGNLTRDPELRYTPNGNAVCSFGVATNKSIKKNDEWVDVPEFHNVVVWGKKAEWVGQNLKKGSKVYVEGRMQTRSWDDQSGQKKYRTEINAQEVISMNARTGNSNYGDGQTDDPLENTPLDDALNDFGGDEDISSDDIPF